MIAETSLDNYRIILSDGTQATQKETILLLIKERSEPNGITLREIAQETGYDINAVSGRVNDLKKDGKVATTDKRKCTVTRRIVAPVKEIQVFDTYDDPMTGKQVPIFT